MPAVKLRADKQDIEHIKRMPKRMTEGLFTGMQRSMSLLERVVTTKYLDGRALKRKSGNLARSIGTETQKRRGEIIGKIGTLRYAVPYASVWEFGGRYPRTIIQPKRARALRFLTMSGEEVYAMSADIPQRIIKAKPYIMPAIKESMTQMLDFLGRGATKEMNK
jgi:phage gpG-like protein